MLLQSVISEIIVSWPFVYVIIQLHSILDLTFSVLQSSLTNPLRLLPFKHLFPHKMIWTFGTMSVCVTMKSEIWHRIYKQAKHSCWMWSIKPYAWLTVRRTVLSLIILNLCFSGTSSNNYITAFVGVPMILDINETKQLNIVQTSLNNIKPNHKHRKHPRQHSPEQSNYRTKASYWL